MKSTAKSKKSDIRSYHDLMFHAPFQNQKRILIGVPTTGLIRAEWAFARMSQIIPCNWSSSDSVHWLPMYGPIGYAVAEARNIIVHRAVTQEFEWLLFIDHDTIMPPDCFVKMDNYMMDGDIPVVSGLYFAKAHPPSPLIYRGRGNGHYKGWKLGDQVWVDGIPMGCTLINVKLLAAMWADAPWYMAGGDQKVKAVFDTPQGHVKSPQKAGWDTYSGTEDLAWCNRVMKGGYLKKAGFPKIQKKEFPFLVDTSIFCKHITNEGQVYPLDWQLVDRVLREKDPRIQKRILKHKEKVANRLQAKARHSIQDYV